MTGKLNVVEPATEVKSPADVAADGKAQLDAILTKLKPVAEQAEKATADTALAGAFSPDVENAGLGIFGPKELSIAVGGSVTWTVLGPHTISFNAPEDAKTLRIESPDGGVHINVKSVSPANSPGQPPPPEGPPPDPNAPPPPPTVIDAGEWDGTGFHSSGLILSFPPALTAYKLTFTKAGTYQYTCLIHPDMDGTVKVGS
jgi:plastocyanin